MLSTTYAVGELSALNGVMGAKAERSIIFHVVGMPSYQNQRLRKIMHHTLGDGLFGNFIDISARAACCHALITPDNCMLEMERVIAEARRNNQPAYIVVPSDTALAAPTPTQVSPLTLKSDQTSLQKAVAAVNERLRSAKSVVALPAFTLSRLRLYGEARRVIEAARLPLRHHSDGEVPHRREPSAVRRSVRGRECPRSRRGGSSRTPTWCSISAA